MKVCSNVPEMWGADKKSNENREPVHNFTNIKDLIREDQKRKGFLGVRRGRGVEKEVARSQTTRRCCDVNSLPA